MGTGFISRGIALEAQRRPFVKLQTVLTRRSPASLSEYPIDPSKITDDSAELVEKSDVVIECSGDPVYATPIVAAVLEAGKPVITMDAELQVTTGSWLKRLGYITEAEGDQPGSIAALNEEVKLMGFRPRVFGNIKGFLNTNPLPQEMEYWAVKSGIRPDQTTSFTDKW